MTIDDAIAARKSFFSLSESISCLRHLNDLNIAEIERKEIIRAVKY